MRHAIRWFKCKLEPPKKRKIQWSNKFWQEVNCHGFVAIKYKHGTNVVANKFCFIQSYSCPSCSMDIETDEGLKSLDLQIVEGDYYAGIKLECNCVCGETSPKYIGQGVKCYQCNYLPVCLFELGFWK